MFKIRVIGLEEGIHNLEIESKKFSALSEEYIFENTSFSGEMQVHTNKITIKGTVSAKLELICDRSGKEFTEKISRNVDLLFKFNIKGIELLDDDIDESLYRLEGNKLNINDLMYEELILALPLKKIAPEYRDVEFEKLFPKFSAKENIEKEEKKDSSTWNELKKLNFN